MFELDHFLDENNWMLFLSKIDPDGWGTSFCVFYKFNYKNRIRRIYLTTSNDFYSTSIQDDSFIDEFLKITNEPKLITLKSYIPQISVEFNLFQAKKALKQKLNQIQERNYIFKKEDMPCLN